MKFFILIGILTISSASPPDRSTWASTGYGTPDPDPDPNLKPSDRDKVQVISDPRISDPWINSNNINDGKAKKASKYSWNDYTSSKCMEDCLMLDYKPWCGTVVRPNKPKYCGQDCGLNVNITRHISCIPFSISGGFERSCIDKCPVTPGFRPLCGTDQITYINEAALDCAKECGRDVKVNKLGPCFTSTPTAISTTTSTTSTTKPLTTEECISKCPVSPVFSPVCGSDGTTYVNIESLQCKINCGVDVKIQAPGMCKPPQPLTTTSTATTKRPTTQECINKCLVSSAQFVPVCGSDGITYINKESLQCYINCGVAITMVAPGICSLPTTTTEKAPTSTTQECIEKCSLTFQFSPVSGTDRTTNINIQNLQCHMSCGVAVNILAPGISSPQSTTTSITTPTPTTTRPQSKVAQKAADSTCGDTSASTNPGSENICKPTSPTIDPRNSFTSGSSPIG